MPLSKDDINIVLLIVIELSYFLTPKSIKIQYCGVGLAIRLVGENSWVEEVHLEGVVLTMHKFSGYCERALVGVA